MSSQLQLLLQLGIPKPKAIYALAEHGNEVEAASDWCFGEGAEWTPQDLLRTTYTPHSGVTGSDPTDPVLSSSHPIQRDNEQQARRQGTNRVPPHRSIHPGVKVHIVLKEDQATGRTVEGEVRDVLTRADHPRGVKVRLKDGRVGRVARLA